MAKRQTRRTISIRGVTYAQLRDHCAGASISMSDFMEQRIADYFAEESRAPGPQLPSPSRSTPSAAVAQSQPPQSTQLPSPLRSQAPRPPATAHQRRTGRSPEARNPFNAPVPARTFAAQQAARAAASPVPPAGRSEAPSPSASAATGRPAPTPAAHHLRDRPVEAPRDVKDYRAIRF